MHGRSGATLAAYIEISMVIKLVIDRELFCLKSEPKHENKEWDFISYFKSDWDGEYYLESELQDLSFIYCEYQIIRDPERSDIVKQ
jgi:hypothetical protein